MKKLTMNFANWKRLGFILGLMVLFIIAIDFFKLYAERNASYYWLKIANQYLTLGFFAFVASFFALGVFRGSLACKRLFYGGLAIIIVLMMVGTFLYPYLYWSTKAKAVWGFNAVQVLAPDFCYNKDEWKPEESNVIKFAGKEGWENWKWRWEELKIPHPAEEMGLQDGDVILKAFGIEHRQENWRKIRERFLTWWESSDETPIPLQIQRGDQVLSLELAPIHFLRLHVAYTFKLWTSQIVDWVSGWWMTDNAFNTLTLPISPLFLIVGLFVILKKPDDEAAILFTIFSWSFGYVLFVNGSSGFFGIAWFILLGGDTNYIGLAGRPGNSPLFDTWSDLGWQTVLGASYIPILILLGIPALILHFFLIFPEKNRFLEKYPIIRIGLYVLPFLSYLVLYLKGILADSMYEITFLVLGFGDFNIPIQLYLFLHIPIGLALFIDNYRHTTETSSKPQLRWILLGMMIPFMLILIQYILELFQLGGSYITFLYEGVTFAYIVSTLVKYSILPSLVFIPLTFAFAIFKYRLMDIDFVIKKSVVYSVSLLILLVLFDQLNSFTTTYLTTDGIQQSGMPQLIMAFIITALFKPLTSHVQTLVEKRFYPERFLYKVTLTEINHKLRQVMEVRQILRLLLERLSSDMRLTSASFFLFDPKRERFVAADFIHQNPQQLGQITFASSDPVIQQLNQHRRTVSFQLQEQLDHRLQIIGARVCLPIFSQNRLCGLLFLGMKRSRDLFTHEDMELLDKIADHASLALENVLLTREMAEQAEWHHELNLAAQIQQELFPQQLPALPRLDIDGFSLPAKQVGGDLYDFIALESSPQPFLQGEVLISTPESDKLGVVIGDVSGKSVPAAMVMAISQGVIQMVARHQPTPAGIMEVVNLALCSRVGKNRFVALCYAEFDLQALSLTYALAGLPPVLLIRRGVVRALPLCDHRLPLGQLRHITFDQKRIDLEPGDFVVFSSDGIDEATAPNGEMYGQARLEMALTGLDSDLTAHEVRNRIMADVLAFSGDAEQHDDMTVVIVKVASINVTRENV